MRIILCPNSPETGELIRKAIMPLGWNAESNLDPRSVRDEVAASQKPTLVVLSTSINGISGLRITETLAGLDTFKPVSVILVGTDNSVNAISSAYEAGADDYIVLPCDTTLISSRLGAAARRLNRFEHMLVRKRASPHWHTHEAAAPVSQRPSTVEPVVPTAPSAPGERATANNLGEEFLSIPTLRDAKEHTLSSFKTLRIPGVVALDNIEFEDSDRVLGAWSTLLLPSRNLWLDVVAEMDRRSADFLYRHITGSRPATSADSTSAIFELVKTLKNELQKSFEKDGEEVLLPTLPRRAFASDLNGLGKFVVDRMRLALGSMSLQVCVSYFASQRDAVFKKIEHLQPREVTDEIIPLANSLHPLLNRGVMLDDRKLDQLKSRFIRSTEEVGIRVYEPSAVSSMFQSA
ncbi:MAG: DNA-binding response regulator [Verrucomicrobia bacterium]|nr:DNA-binding response regulator [Verrucomicrobiota bacterium]